MKLSVVIPVYNGGDFIEKSYSSIIQQNIEDFEILYVNNNSTDDSKKNIINYTHKDSRVRLLEQPKQGAAAARNMGIKAAEGEYIYVFDVDDEIYPNALKKMISVLDENISIAAVFGKMVKSNTGIDLTGKPDDETGKIEIKAPPYFGLQWFSSLKTVVGPPAFLYRKTVFDKIGVYNENLKIGEDTALDIKLGMSCTIAFIDIYVYLYFKHTASTMEKYKKKIPRAFGVWLRLINEHLPFYLNNDTPIRFKELLFNQLFQSMGRQVVFTKEFSKRFQLKEKLFIDIKDIKVPLIIRLYLTLLVILPLEVLRKIYGYYIVPFAVKKLIK